MEVKEVRVSIEWVVGGEGFTTKSVRRVWGLDNRQADCPVKDVQFFMCKFEECTEEEWGAVCGVE